MKNKKFGRLGRSFKTRVCSFLSAALFTISSVPFSMGAKAAEPVEEHIPVEEVVVVEPMVVPEIKEEETVYMTEIEYLAEPIEERPEPVELPYSQQEMELIAKITHCEAGNQPEEGIRWVIDAIMNRVESSRWPDTIHDVIFAKNPIQFDTAYNGALDRAPIRDDILKLVVEESVERTNYEVTSFRTGHYHNWGTPVAKIGDHYFSK